MKILRVNMTTQHILSEEIPNRYMGLVGRALTATIIHHEDLNDTLSPFDKPRKRENP